MQYLLLIYENEQRFASAFDPAELAEYQQFGHTNRNSIRGGNALKPTPAAKTVRVRDGKSIVTDGPFAETKEQLGGYYLVEAESIESALDMAQQIPAARFGSIEVRPIQTFA